MLNVVKTAITQVKTNNYIHIFVCMLFNQLVGILITNCKWYLIETKQK